VWLRELRAHATVQPRGEDELISVDRRATLNDALDSMLTSGHGGVVVTGRRDEYLGVVDFERVTELVQATQASHAEEGPDAGDAATLAAADGARGGSQA
jgi:osmoprotectant transport system ATP-binding protein